MTVAKALALALTLAAGLVAAADPPASAPQKRVAFLGVGVQPVAPQEGTELGLPEGVGLTVRSVDERSPAQNRINVGDILQALDSQILIHPYQLAVLVRTYAPGTEVKVSLLRGGNEMDVPVVLGEREATPLPPGGWGPMAFTLGQGPGGAIRLDPVGVNGTVTINVAGGTPATAQTAATVVAVSSGTENRRTATAVENGTGYTLNSVNGIATYTVTGPDGTVLFTGPVTTDAEKARVPEAYRAKLEALAPKPAPGVPAGPTPGGAAPATP